MAWSEALARAELILELRNCLSWMEGSEVPAPLAIFMDPASPENSLRTALLQYLSVRRPVVKDSQITVREGDGLRVNAPELLERAGKIVVILDNLRSVFNVGSIFRSAECLALAELALCGITPNPNQAHMAKTAMGTTERVSWSCFVKTSDAINHYRKRGYTIIALETAESAGSVFGYQARLPLALVLGNESLGIAQEVLALCDGCIALPVLGWKNSLNVGVAFAVTAYQLVFAAQSDE